MARQGDPVSIPVAFSPEVMHIRLDALFPSRSLPTHIHVSKKYRQILASVKGVGLIEPLSVIALDESKGHYTVLDGHVRVLVLQELGHEDAPCLVARDDEGYTYNSRINRLSSIQESRMLQEAISKGVPAEQLAKSLNIDPSQLRKRLRLLEGICPEAIELLQDRQFSSEISRVLRKMKATRQVECVELMLAANSLTVNYCEALLVATPAELLLGEAKPRALKGVTTEQMARMEREMSNLQLQLNAVEDSYAEDVLNLVLAQGYLAKLLANAEVHHHLLQENPEICEQLTAIVALSTLDQ